MAENKKILLSGVKPTGRPHIGNYFGAMKQFVDLQNEYNCYFMLADYHALTTLQNATELKRNTLDLAIDYLTIGLDPANAVIFKQSDVSEHTELAWIFNCILKMPYLMRAHAFKDVVTKTAKVISSSMPLEYTVDTIIRDKGVDAFKDVTVGTFDYPLLMAADILLYNTDVVPVGQDQKQHIEYARDTAEKFNNIFGDTFKLPEEKIVSDLFTENGSMVGIDGRKMSKSYNNHIPLFSSDEEIKKLVMKIETDSSDGEPINVRAIHFPIRKALYPNELTGDYFKNLYSEKRGQYQALKEALITDLIAFITPLRKKREEIASKPDKVLEILKMGADKAKLQAEKKMSDIKDKVGVK
jgi:tryptophanyl-tRNA synthetase